MHTYPCNHMKFQGNRTCATDTTSRHAVRWVRVIHDCFTDTPALIPLHCSDTADTNDDILLLQVNASELCFQLHAGLP